MPIRVYTGTHCLEPPTPPSETGLEIQYWKSGDLTNFFSIVSYQCRDGLKFKPDFDQVDVRTTCLPGNLWSPNPPSWEFCTETKHCPLPPTVTNGGSVTVLSSGFRFNKECPGGSGRFELLETSGCPMQEFHIRRKTTIVSEPEVTDHYEIVILGAKGISLVALMVFNQPISYVTIDIIGQSNVIMQCKSNTVQSKEY